jgi:hypothetical protein
VRVTSRRETGRDRPARSGVVVVRGTPLRCRLGWHRWFDDTDAEDAAPVIVCVRCHKTVAKPYEIMARVGWVGHQNS